MQILALVVTVVLSQPTAPGPARRALVVGIDKYDPPALVDGGVRTDPRTWASLDGAVNDAESVARLLRERYGFPAANVRLLANEQATRAAILEGLAQLARDSKPGDQVVFYYAGHGSQQTNSLSDEWDKKDETLVPADWHSGGADLRDKQLAVALNAILDSKAELTAVFDSCHSGSNTRGMGKTRNMDEAVDDAKDPLRIVADLSKCPAGQKCVLAPEARGALVISATQDNELAREVMDNENHPRGAFTWALVQSVEDGAQVSVEKLFARVAARMQMTPSQHPELRGPRGRRALTLAGAAVPKEGRYPVLVSKVAGKTVVLNAGTAAGLAPGCELSSLDGKAKLKLTEVKGLSLSTAALLTTEAPAVGAELRVTKWVRGGFTPLTVFSGPPVAKAKWDELARQRTTLLASKELQPVEDPVEAEVDGVVLWDGKAWQLSGRGRTTSLGPSLSAPGLVAALRVSSPRVAVLLPPRAPLGLTGWDDDSSVVQRVEQLSLADYALVGLPGAKGARWALVNLQAFTAAPVPMPARTEWLDDADKGLQAALDEKGLALARVKGWLTLNRPGNESGPWELVVEAAASQSQVGVMLAGLGESVRVLLKPTPGAELNGRSYYVYLMAVSSDGSSTALYPSKDTDKNVHTPSDKPIVLLDNVLVQEPIGIDHLVMLATEDKLPSVALLTTDAVRAARDTALTGLGALVQGVGVRGLSGGVPAGWDLQRASLRTVRPWAAAEAQPPAKSRGKLANDGPLITVKQPTGSSGRVPLDIELEFTPRQAPVDPQSLKVELVSLIDIDVTKMVRESSVITASGLRSKTAQPGKARLRVSLADLQGKKTAVEFDFEAKP
jgi:uncharacterized caspase-like protein